MKCTRVCFIFNEWHYVIKRIFDERYTVLTCNLLESDIFEEKAEIDGEVQ